MSQNDRRLIAYQVGERTDMPIVTAPLNREWMELTDQRYAYRCLPLAIANQAGWVLLNPLPFTALWDGGESRASLKITFEPGHSDKAIHSHFGVGILTFSLPYLFRTPVGINLWVKGVSNWIKDGAQPLEGVVETDWASATFTMNWKLTRPNHLVRFERGEPICMIVPLTRGLAEDLEPVCEPLRNNAELAHQYEEWNEKRKAFLAALEGGQPEASERGWQRDYMQGKHVVGGRAPEHQTRLRLKEFSPSPVVPAAAPFPQTDAGLDAVAQG